MNFGVILAIIEALGHAQAINRMNSYILTEIVSDLAQASPYAQKYISGMFELVSARADQGQIVDELHPARAEFRDSIARFFLKVGQTAD